MGFRKRSIEVKEAGCFKQTKRNNAQIVGGKESSRAFNESKVTERALLICYVFEVAMRLQRAICREWTLKVEY